MGIRASLCDRVSTWRFPFEFRPQPGALPMIRFPTASVSPCRIRRSLVMNFLEVAFQLRRPNLGRMLGQHAPPRRLAHCHPGGIGAIPERAECIVAL